MLCGNSSEWKTQQLCQAFVLPFCEGHVGESSENFHLKSANMVCISALAEALCLTVIIDGRYGRQHIGADCAQERLRNGAAWATSLALLFRDKHYTSIFG